ncbi:11S globulin seed storage 2-like [Olea europaea subsp. europaea]|uniref:11S globulin seed storage 2-like n=1 Tax=Olea europaea subsp. europaea TaxID=158383 RepID=A0A8S0TZU5_OLEEU|nr:11S globulin seed storage 2-like [Olea europaea subsp. europaea]
MASKFLLALFLSMFLSSAMSQSTPHLSEAQKCHFQRLSVSQPSRQIQSEGGVTELWEENQEQFQCAGVAAMKNTIRPNSLSLPNYQPTPRLVYIERGQGYISVAFPGCAETYEFQQTQMTQESQQDLHQKVHRIRQGDIIAIPAGAVHWCYNDGFEDLVAVSVNDLNHVSNQLDQKSRSFYLAGGVPNIGQQQQESETFQNILRPFDSNLMAEAFNIPAEIVQKMQSPEQNQRGLIVNVQGRLSFLRPDEGQEQGQGPYSDNGLEESLCTMKIRTNIENHIEADIYSRQGGKVNVVDRHKLPLLKYMDMSAERGRIYKGALVTPHWSMHSHTIVYVTGGDAQVQIVDNNGRTVMNDRVSQGNIFVVPQFYTSTAKAGGFGFQWVAFKTTGWPMRSSLAGYTSVIRAMPLQVLTNSYQISPNQAQQIKENRGGESFVLSSRSGYGPGFSARRY